MMAASPPWKAFRGNEYIASFKYAEDAAAAVSNETATSIKFEHGGKPVYAVAEDGIPDSWDAAAALMHQRVKERRDAAADTLASVEEVA